MPMLTTYMIHVATIMAIPAKYSMTDPEEFGTTLSLTNLRLEPAPFMTLLDIAMIKEYKGSHYFN
ncbi:unnamed protein product [Kuraishia capsulata CBS 1993]|uniref:Uncharacterized protein n=1 Tax=Kuraishia capsulata CBS 1993 TaxID=1382522 RepID=W6MQH9_9ASCO|nr:uncharacterized protein KUCA_T00004932001 [Kuraishia capsulata CBS 1993]CDK28946.1 unnamed protein product [Kuraishia capsulata CBS 1993]